MPEPDEPDAKTALVIRLDKAMESIMKQVEDPDVDAATRMKAFDRAVDWLKDRARIVGKPGAIEQMGIEALRKEITAAVKHAAIGRPVVKTNRQNKNAAAAAAKARANGADSSGAMSANLQSMLDKLAQQ